MRILQANKFFSIKGGSETVFFETINGLRERGHTVAEFSMQAPGNLPSDYAQFFVSTVRLTGDMPLGEKWKAFRRFFSSTEVTYKLRELAHLTHPEVAHLHNVYHELSASTFTTLREFGIPTVMTVHDFFPLCANHNLLLGEHLAEEKLAGKAFNCFGYKAINNSRLQSLAGMLEMHFYKANKIWQQLDMLVCPSEFVKEKLIQYGFNANKLAVIPNPVESPMHINALGTKIVFAGRLHVEKGIRVFMRALTRLAKYQVLIVGDGPEAQWVDAFIAEHKLTNVERRGWVAPDAMSGIYKEARVVAVPSIFYETGGLSALEALAHSRLVVASKRGALSEAVLDRSTGFLAEAENPEDLARAIDMAMQVPDTEARAIVERGRKLVMEKHSRERYLDSLENMYRSVVRH